MYGLPVMAAVSMTIVTVMATPEVFSPCLSAVLLSLITSRGTGRDVPPLWRPPSQVGHTEKARL